MAKLVLVEFVTLDGVMQGYGGPDEDRDGGFDLGGWGDRFRTQAPSPSPEAFSTTSAYLFGRRTYEKMVQFWPHQSGSNPMAAHLNSTPKHVVTATLSELEWSNASVCSGDIDDEVHALKRSYEGDIVVLGSWRLTHRLIDGGHVDAYRLFVHPIVLGTGKELFRPVERPLDLRLVDATPMPSGVVVLNYAAG